MEGPLCCFPYHPYCPQGGRNWTLDTQQPCTAGHPRRTREGPKRIEAGSASLQSLKIETHQAAGSRRITLTFLMVAVLFDPGTAGPNPHQPARITWMLWNGLTHEVLNLTTGIHPPNTWWPDLYFNLKDLIQTTWTAAQTRNFGFWACPGHLKTHNWEICGGGCNIISVGPGAV